jgi:hypothetical protein
MARPRPLLPFSSNQVLATMGGSDFSAARKHCAKSVQNPFDPFGLDERWLKSIQRFWRLAFCALAATAASVI